ncbi:MAG: DUF2029 domain-containing protein, partial [Leptospiraceae bacterium]|nr:DUF2029 domain-containing protein [Leptospiraceae bacterium]
IPLIISFGLLDAINAPFFIMCTILLSPIISFGFPKLSSYLPESLDQWFQNTKKFVLLLWGIGVLISWFSLGSLSIFLMDFKYSNYSVLPDDSFIIKHSCLTAYTHGSILAEDPSLNVYDLSIVDLKKGDPYPPTAEIFKPFKLDAYGYPPPFLLFPKLLLLITKNYMSLRAMFSGISMLIAILTAYILAKTLGNNHEKRIFIFTPLLISSPAIAITLQVGNFHLTAISISLLVWAYLEKNKNAISGTLLSIVTLSKISPGILGIMLVFQKKYKAILSVIISTIIICGITYLVFGGKIWNDFIFYHIPQVQTGRALSFLAESEQNIEFNIAPFGIPFKLRALGILNIGWKEAKTASNIFSIFLLIITILAAFRKGSPRFRLTIWISILMFGSLKSPYAAAFVMLTVSFLFLILVCELKSVKSIVLYIIAFILFSFHFPISNPKIAIGVSLIRVSMLYIFLLWIIFRKEKPSGRGFSQGVG